MGPGVSRRLGTEGLRGSARKCSKHLAAHTLCAGRATEVPSAVRRRLVLSGCSFAWLFFQWLRRAMRHQESWLPHQALQTGSVRAARPMEIGLPSNGVRRGKDRRTQRVGGGRLSSGAHARSERFSRSLATILSSSAMHRANTCGAAVMTGRIGSICRRPRRPMSSDCIGFIGWQNR